MQTVGARANAIFAYAVMVTFGLLALNIISRLNLPSDPKVEVKLNKIDKL